jgi:hypothetical protein
MEGIDPLMGTAYFESLKKISAKDFLDRYEAYQSYLEQFPLSEEREAVERMIRELANETAGSIEKQIAGCDRKADWEPCIAHCDEFLSAFESPADTVQKVQRMRSNLIEQKDLSDLTARASLVSDDYKKSRQIYIFPCFR